MRYKLCGPACTHLNTPTATQVGVSEVALLCPERTNAQRNQMEAVHPVYRGRRQAGRAEENSSQTSRQVSDPMTDTKPGCGSNMARLELGRKSRSLEF